ncbi:N-acetylglucosamine-6-phosphate deacetylase [Defluviimonas sp. SAOS-178_SWC]|uniref:N-acetylglucosamine-6-phosphate deacetylase n=1 Tax=Defluviimonas sp. SAOS-178_SWC TaxID=3121287 RepID=UPI003221E54A
MAKRLFDGVTSVFQTDRAIVLRDGMVTELRAATAGDRRNDQAVHVAVAAPGMIDMQINGAGDAQFNFDPTPATLARIAAGAREGGTAHILPTFITAEGQSYLQALAAVRQAMDDRMPGIAGIHLEGPFLSPARPGIHDPSSIRPLAEDDVIALEREARDFPGPILLTLAPECQEPAQLNRLAAAGIILFAGHSEARPEHLEQMRGATHLWNAMPGLNSRTPGIVSEVLAGDRLFAGLIADGHHVGPHALRISLRAAADRLCLVTDAMLTLAGASQGFDLHGRHITLSDGRLTGEDGTLAGAHIAMDQSVSNVVAIAGIDPLVALRTATVNPARALGREKSLGRIAPGLPASVSLFDRSLNSVGVAIEGQLYLRD